MQVEPSMIIWVRYIAEHLVKKLIRNQSILKNARLVVMGITFKENVTDIQEFKVVDIISELKSFGLQGRRC